MVTAHSTRTRARASKPPVPPTPTSNAPAARWAQELTELKARLEIISSTVAVNALEAQNAEIDLDVANTLRMCHLSAQRSH